MTSRLIGRRNSIPQTTAAILSFWLSCCLGRIACLGCLACIGCAGTPGGSSSGKRTSTERYDLVQGSSADAAAFGLIDSFTFGVKQEVRPANDYEFYFKECELGSPDNSKAFFSKTAYSCTAGPFE